MDGFDAVNKIDLLIVCGFNKLIEVVISIISPSSFLCSNDY